MSLISGSKTKSYWRPKFRNFFSYLDGNPLLAQVHLGFFVVQLKALDEAYREVQANAASNIQSLVNMPAHI